MTRTQIRNRNLKIAATTFIVTYAVSYAMNKVAERKFRKTLRNREVLMRNTLESVDEQIEIALRFNEIIKDF